MINQLEQSHFKIMSCSLANYVISIPICRETLKGLPICPSWELVGDILECWLEIWKLSHSRAQGLSHFEFSCQEHEPLQFVSSGPALSRSSYNKCKALMAEYLAKMRKFQVFGRFLLSIFEASSIDQLVSGERKWRFLWVPSNDKTLPPWPAV